MKASKNTAPAQVASRLIHHSSDDYGNILVLEYPQYRVLSFDSTYEQSGYCVERPFALVHEYTRIMMLALGFIAPQHITLLGLGGGSLLRSLHFYLKHCDFHVVELRQKVFAVAKNYFAIPTGKRVTFSIDDAIAQLRLGKKNTTDIIFSDIYDAADMSSIQLQKDFLLESERILSRRGWLVINFHKLPDKHSVFFAGLQELFPSILICPGEYDSHVLFAGKAYSPPSGNMEREAGNLEAMLGGEFKPLLLKLKPLLL